MSETSGAGGPVRAKADDSVTDLELFFDLVFVFAVTQVTSLMARQADWAGVGKGLLVLSALWFSWTAYAWFTTTIDPDEGITRLTIFATMVGLFVASLAVPHAFGDDALIFGVAALYVRALPVIVFAFGPGRTSEMVRTLGPFHLLTGLFVLAAGIVDGPARYACWLAATASSLTGPFVADLGWSDISPEHFSKRHGGFVIIVLGESIVSAGAGIEGRPLTLELVVAGVLAVIVAGGLWWTYFDTGVLVGARRLAQVTGAARERLARDAYTFLHLPIVAGVVLFALGLRNVFAHLDMPLELVPAVAVCGGLALTVAGEIGFALRTAAQFSWRRAATALVLLALIPVARHVDAIVALALVTAACWTSITYELVRYGDTRDRLRHPGRDRRSERS